MKHTIPAKPLMAILCVTVFSILFTSCIKDDFQFDKLTTTQWNPTMAVPIANSSLKLEDFIPEDDNLVTGTNNELLLIYESLYESPIASEIYPIQDQNFNQSVDFPGLPPGTPVDTGSVVIDTTMMLNFIAPTAMEIDSILFKSGQWNFNFSSSFKQSGNLQIIIKDAKRNGLPFISTVPFNYTGTLPVTTSASYGLSNYWFDLSRQGASFNEIEVRYIVTLINNGNTYAPTNTIAIDQSILSINFREIHGYFGEQSITTDADTIDFSVFQNDFQYSSLSLTSPSLIIDIRNSFGMPIEAQLNQFSTYSTQNGYSAIVGPGLPNPINVIGPDISQMGQAILTSINLDKNNSNLATVLNNKPEAFLYNSNAFTNPAGRVDKNFIEENSQFTVNSQFEIPLEGTFDKLLFSDTMDFTLGAIEEIESIKLLTNIGNGFPMDFEIQLYFLDENNNVLDSLNEQSILLIESAPVDPATGIVTAKENKKNVISISEDRVSALLNASKIIMHASSSTFTNGTVPVKIKSDYELDIKLGALVTVKMEF